MIHGFDKRGAERVVEAVRWTERHNRGGPPQRKKGSRSQAGLWAVITGNDTYKYSWSQLEPQTDGSLTVNEDWLSAETTDDIGFAVEENYTSEHVLTDSIVWLMPSASQDYYLFQYSPGLIIAKTTSTVSARSGTTAGSGSAMSQNFDGTSYTDHVSMTVFNPFSSALASGTWIEAEWSQGYWHITGADC